jgi:hypothetical protein
MDGQDIAGYLKANLDLMNFFYPAHPEYPC